VIGLAPLGFAIDCICSFWTPWIDLSRFLATPKTKKWAATVIGHNCFPAITRTIIDRGYNLSDDDTCKFTAAGSANHVADRCGGGSCV
jgi:hypothetical protein